MTARPTHKRRYRATPTDLEMNVRAIRMLSPPGWRLFSLKEFPIVGAAPKNYLAFGDPYKPGILAYIAKRGRTSNDARECVTEEIISKIGASLPLEMAVSKLARLSGTDVRFLSQNFVTRGQHELLHFIELVARYFEVNPGEVEAAFDLKDKQKERHLYTIHNVLLVLRSLYPESYDSLKKGFFKMLAFDAFIGAPDRHAMNWGVLAPLGVESEVVRFAPVFDTARGLFREYSDADLLERERREGREKFLTKYADRSKPIICMDQNTKPNHFELIKWILANPDDMCSDAIREVLDAVDICRIEHMLQRHLRRIVTQHRIGFIRDLLSHRIGRIRKESRQ